MILFESARLYVRYLDKNDLDNFHRLNGDEEIMRYIRAPKNYEETAVLLAESIGKYTPGSLDLRLGVIRKEDGVFVGSFAIIPIDKTTDTQLGYSFLKDEWGKGYATEVTDASFPYIFETLKLAEIFAVTEKDNIASQKVLLKAGFKHFSDYEEGGKELIKFRRFAL